MSIGFPIICYVWEKVKLYKFYLHFIHAPSQNLQSRHIIGYKNDRERGEKIMPSTYAHYRLGQQVRRELEGNERKSLRNIHSCI